MKQELDMKRSPVNINEMYSVVLASEVVEVLNLRAEDVVEDGCVD